MSFVECKIKKEVLVTDRNDIRKAGLASKCRYEEGRLYIHSASSGKDKSSEETAIQHIKMREALNEPTSQRMIKEPLYSRTSRMKSTTTSGCDRKGEWPESMILVVSIPASLAIRF